MPKAHVEHDNEQITVKDVGLKVDDIEADNPNVQKVVLKIEGEDKDITYKPRKEVRKQVTRNGAKMFTPTKVPKTRGELHEAIEELIQVNANSNRSFDVNISYHEWNQAEDPEEENNETYYYLQERHLEDLTVIAPEDAQEEQDEDADYVEVKFLSEVPEFMGTDLESYGGFEEGDTAEIPKENAEVLVNRGSAEEV